MLTSWRYSEAEKFAVVEIEVPAIGDDDVLVRISACGVCGTDLHYHKGEFLAKVGFLVVDFLRDGLVDDQ